MKCFRLVPVPSFTFYFSVLEVGFQIPSCALASKFSSPLLSYALVLVITPDIQPFLSLVTPGTFSPDVHFHLVSLIYCSVPSACHSRCSINVMYRDELWQICPPILSRNASAFSASLKGSSCLKSFWFFLVRFVLHRPPLVRGPLSQGQYGTLSFRWIYNVFIWHSQWLHLVTSLTGCTCRGSRSFLKGTDIPHALGVTAVLVCIVWKIFSFVSQNSC